MVSELWYLEQRSQVNFLHSLSPALSLACCSREKTKLWSQGDLCSNLDSTTKCATCVNYPTSPNLSFLVSELRAGRADVKDVR